MTTSEFQTWRETLSHRKDRTERTTLNSKDLVYVPYCSTMIPYYRNWFFDKYLCEMTSTECMSVAEAEAAHHVWTTDADKVTFIVLNRPDYDKTGDQIRTMIGDVNLVIDSSEPEVSENPRRKRAEVMLMLGDSAFRGQGLGSQMLSTITRFAVEEYDISSLMARINRANAPCLRMFMKAGFELKSLDKTFEEFTLELDIDVLKRREIIQKSDKLRYTLSVASARGEIGF